MPDHPHPPAQTAAPGRPVRLVAIDDDADITEFVQQALSDDNVKVFTAGTPDEGWSLIRNIGPDIVILDQNMPQTTGMELLARIADFDPSTDVILLTGEYSTDLAVEAIQRGAAGFLTKPISLAVLRARIAPFIEAAGRRHRAVSLERQLLSESTFCGMIGNSAPMGEVFAMVSRIAPHFRSVLVTGPTGTGKELVARALHRMSPVAAKPLVVCNCAAIVETLFESELFGHARGSYTGATADRAGLFEAADGGTLFLDEIGEVPLKMQAKFLRALQNGEVQRVGTNTVRKVNVRVIAATNKDLAQMVHAREFREDLYYRLSMLEIGLPSLMERKEDLPLLIHHFVEYFSRQMDKEIRGVTRRAQTVLARYHWPGNVRELENVIGHACTMSDGGLIDLADLPSKLRAGHSKDENRSRMTLAEVERQHVLFIYEQVAEQNKQLAAEILGISRATLYRLLSDYKPTG